MEPRGHASHRSIEELRNRPLGHCEHEKLTTSAPGAQGTQVDTFATVASGHGIHTEALVGLTAPGLHARHGVDAFGVKNPGRHSMQVEAMAGLYDPGQHV
jgi:hypothetical protein